jgi:hypothetical protein
MRATYNNVTRNAFKVGQVKSTATIPQLAGENEPSNLLKSFSSNCNICLIVASYFYTGIN